MKLKDTIKQGIEVYTGRPLASCKTYTDSVGAIAIRATFVPSKSKQRDDLLELDFLIMAYDVEKCKDPQTTAKYLEECEFDTWPPKESGPKFF